MIQITINPLDEGRYERFNLATSWEARQDSLKAHPDFRPRELVIGRVATKSTEPLQSLKDGRELLVPDSILERRLDLFRAISQHCRQSGPKTLLFAGRTGNRTLHGTPRNLPNNGVVLATPLAEEQHVISHSMNNPFNYMYYRSRHFRGTEPFVPALAVFDGSRLQSANGNGHDKTSWKSKTGNPLGALAALYYFSPNDFAFFSKSPSFK